MKKIKLFLLDDYEMEKIRIVCEDRKCSEIDMELEASWKAKIAYELGAAALGLLLSLFGAKVTYEVWRKRHGLVIRWRGAVAFV